MKLVTSSVVLNIEILMSLDRLIAAVRASVSVLERALFRLSPAVVATSVKVEICFENDEVVLSAVDWKKLIKRVAVIVNESIIVSVTKRRLCVKELIVNTSDIFIFLKILVLYAAFKVVETLRLNLTIFNDAVLKDSIIANATKRLESVKVCASKILVLFRSEEHNV